MAGSKAGRKKRLITYNSLAMDVLGPRDREKESRAVEGRVKDFLQSVELGSRDLLKECAKTSPELKGFRLRFS